MWLYRDALFTKEQVRIAVEANYCLYCNSLLSAPYTKHDTQIHKLGNTTEVRKIRICPGCGWWSVRGTNTNISNDGDIVHHFGSAGLLRKFFVPSDDTPLREIKDYLVAKYDEAIECLTPNFLQEVVASVYRNLKFSAVVTGKRGDGGIDVVLRKSDEEEIAVQVKLYGKKVGVEHIRAFMGALIGSGMLKGYFVTTSDFTKGAVDFANHPNVRNALFGNPIRLINAKDFYETLKMSQIDSYSFDDDPQAPFNKAHTIVLDTERTDNA